ncbi:uncharacterized protein [Drosophila suzukii]|uniref:Reverse transcriptase domain-containing protein n=1 Tax=Drosophila suzukii TaxID=28584 RepID=A0ABM4TXC1_DROSZ
MGPSEDLAAVEKKTSGFDMEAINVLICNSSLVDAAFQLLIYWATSIVSSVMIATAVAALFFRVAVIFVSLYNTCLLEGTFPDRWKRQKLLLLPKPGKTSGEASSYRPICLLDTIGTVFERVIATRLNAAMEEADDEEVLSSGHAEHTDCVCAIRAVEEWLSVAGLELASHKTEALLISSRKAVESAQIGYLGVMLDTRLLYREHLEYVNRKASETTGSLCRILLNTRGPKQDRRMLLVTVVKSQLLCAALVWAEATAVSQVLLCELVREAKEIRAALADDQTNHRAKTEVKRSARMKSVDNWQAAWDNSSKGRWTHQLIPSIELWLNRKHGQRFGHDCGSGIVEDAQHVLFECGRFGYDRQTLMETTGARVRLETFVPIMLLNEVNWEATAAYAASVL